MKRNFKEKIIFLHMIQLLTKNGFPNLSIIENYIKTYHLNLSIQQLLL